MISTKYYIAIRRRRYFIWWDTSNTEKVIYIYINKWRLRERQSNMRLAAFMISMKYYIAKRRRRYFISWDTSKAELMIYIFLQMKKKRERDDPIWDWQFHDINEILYRRKKKTIFHIMRNIQNSKYDLYIYIYHFCCFECISWYEISSFFFFDDIIFH